MMKYKLIRGDAILGVVTHAPDERIDGGGLWDVGWLERGPKFEPVWPLFADEQRLFDAALQLEAANGQTAESDALLAQAGELQRQLLQPGIRLICLEGSKRLEVTEVHVEGTKVFWR